MLTSIIIPFRGDPSLLAWTLEGYANQILPAGDSAEILIGADGCDLPPLPTNKSNITFSAFAFERTGAAGIRNRLIEKSHGEILLFGNADCRPDPNLIAIHTQRLMSLPKNSLVLGSAPWESPAHPNIFDLLLAHTPMVFFYNSLRAGELYDFRHAWTLNLSVRRNDLPTTSPFNEKLRPVYYEDLAFAHNILGSTTPGVYYEPTARVLHRHPTTLDQYLDREELLGLMTPVLAKVAGGAEVFAAIHPDTTIEKMTADFKTFVELDHPMHAWIYKRLQHWVTRPATSIPGAPSPQDFLDVIYQMHIPLKRLAFRLGFLRGLMLTEDSRWLERQPHSLWKKIVT